MGYKTFGAYSSTKGKKKGSPVLEDDAEAWRAHCRNVVAIVEGTVVGETAPQEPVMAGEVVPGRAVAEVDEAVEEKVQVQQSRLPSLRHSACQNRKTGRRPMKRRSAFLART